jgi:hypothetical protein
MQNEKITIRRDELFSPRVDAAVAELEALRASTVAPAEVSGLRRILFNSMFYLALAGAAGGLLGWAVIEPFFNDFDPRGNTAIGIFVFAIVNSCVALLIGGAEGIAARNFGRSALSAAVGIGIAFVGGVVALLPAGVLFMISISLGLALGGPPPGDHGMPRGLLLLFLIIGRGLAWAVFGMTVGLGQGIALRSKRLVLNGFLGGMLGAMLGGMLFDPLYLLLHGFEGTAGAASSRAVGFATIGVLAGLFIGAVEHLAREAWFLMRTGPLLGKQFVLYRNPTILGSSPKADVYLFKDPDIEPRHAAVHTVGNRREIEDLGTPGGTFVNGRPVRRQVLRDGDQIQVGSTLIDYLEKAKD